MEHCGLAFILTYFLQTSAFNMPMTSFYFAWSLILIACCSHCSGRTCSIGYGLMVTRPELHHIMEHRSFSSLEEPTNQRSPSAMIFVALVSLAALFGSAKGLNNQGVAKLPVLGYNTWNRYQCNISSQLLLDTAQSLKDLGLQAAGYLQVNLDDCWSLPNRTANGTLQWDPTKFPEGIPALAAELKSMGFKMGIYGDSGTNTCAGYPGSFGYEEQDAATFTSWGLNYLKYDNCAPPPDNILQASIPQKFERMSNAISTVASTFNSTPLIFSLCEWGQSQPWLWAANVGQSWRITGDVTATWSSFASIINTASFITIATGFYGHNDLDMLEIGNGNLTYDEAKSHFTAWALFKAPLLIGTDLTSITEEHLEILSNPEILAINQDPVVSSGIAPFAWGLNADWTFDPVNPAQFYSGQTSNGTVVMLLNPQNDTSTLCFNVTDSPWLAPARQYVVRDLWSHTDNCTVTGSTTTALGAMGFSIPTHGVSALLFTDVGNGSAVTGLPACSAALACNVTSSPVS